MEKHQTIDTIAGGSVDRFTKLYRLLLNLDSFINDLEAVVATILDRGFINKGSGSYYYSLFSQMSSVMEYSKTAMQTNIEEVCSRILAGRGPCYAVNQLKQNHVTEDGFKTGCMLYDPNQLNPPPINQLVLESNSLGSKSLIFLRNWLLQDDVSFLNKSGVIDTVAEQTILADYSSDYGGIGNILAVLTSPSYLYDMISRFVGYVVNQDEDNSFYDSSMLSLPNTRAGWFLPDYFDFTGNWISSEAGNGVGVYVPYSRTNSLSYLRYGRSRSSNLFYRENVVQCTNINSIWVTASTLRFVLSGFPKNDISCGLELAKGLAQMMSEFAHVGFDSSASQSDMKNWIYNYIMANMVDKCYSNKLLNKNTIDPFVDQFLARIL